MRICRSRTLTGMGLGVGAMVLALAPLTVAARAAIHDRSKSSAWIMDLKCRDLIGLKEKSINRAVFPVYSVWLRGYIAGVSSLAPISITSNVKFSDVSASLLTYCTSHQEQNSVEAAVHIGSLFYNVLNPQNQGTDLHQPGTSKAPE
jgi:hypothetical protein